MLHRVFSGKPCRRTFAAVALALPLAMGSCECDSEEERPATGDTNEPLPTVSTSKSKSAEKRLESSKEKDAARNLAVTSEVMLELMGSELPPRATKALKMAKSSSDAAAVSKEFSSAVTESKELMKAFDAICADDAEEVLEQAEKLGAGAERAKHVYRECGLGRAGLIDDGYASDNTATLVFAHALAGHLAWRGSPPKIVRKTLQQMIAESGEPLFGEPPDEP